MAFNMKEDMEEGHFDKDGNFIYKKEIQIKDAWLDNINWENIKDAAGKHWKPKTSQGEEVEGEEAEGEDQTKASDRGVIYTRLLELLNDKETVAASLKRLNSEKGLSAAEERKRRWAAKKAGVAIEDDNSKTVSEITTLADSLISMGSMEAYQMDSKRIKELLDGLKKTDYTQGSTEFDMFSDSAMPSTSQGATKEKYPGPVSSTMWEYRIKGDEPEKLFGPISTAEISEKAADLLKKGATVRRVGTDSFYDIRRIDFDLFE